MVTRPSSLAQDRESSPAETSVLTTMPPTILNSVQVYNSGLVINSSIYTVIMHEQTPTRSSIALRDEGVSSAGSYIPSYFRPLTLTSCFSAPSSLLHTTTSLHFWPLKYQLSAFLMGSGFKPSYPAYTACLISDLGIK